MRPAPRRSDLDKPFPATVAHNQQLFIITLAFRRRVTRLPGWRFTASSYALLAVETSETRALTTTVPTPSSQIRKGRHRRRYTPFHSSTGLSIAAAKRLTAPKQNPLPDLELRHLWLNRWPSQAQHSVALSQTASSRFRSWPLLSRLQVVFALGWLHRVLFSDRQLPLQTLLFSPLLEQAAR